VAAEAIRGMSVGMQMPGGVMMPRILSWLMVTVAVVLKSAQGPTVVERARMSGLSRISVVLRPALQCKF
jgi:hypothetical protein